MQDATKGACGPMPTRRQQLPATLTFGHNQKAVLKPPAQMSCAGGPPSPTLLLS